MLEAIALCEEIAGEELEWTYEEANRIGDHIWWIGDNGRFECHYPSWQLEYDVPRILQEIHDANVDRWQPSGAGGRLAREASPARAAAALAPPRLDDELEEAVVVRERDVGEEHPLRVAASRSRRARAAAAESV